MSLYKATVEADSEDQLGLQSKVGWEERGDKVSCKPTDLCFSHSRAAVVTCRKDLSWDDCCFLTSDKRQKQRPALLFSSLTENN